MDRISYVIRRDNDKLSQYIVKNMFKIYTQKNSEKTMGEQLCAWETGGKAKIPRAS